MKYLFVPSLIFVISISVYAQSDSDRPVKVAVRELPPFVMKSGDRFQGFAIDIWKEVAERENFRTQYVQFETLGELLEAVRTGKADVACEAISITAERERQFNLTFPYMHGGLQAMTTQNKQLPLKRFFHSALNILLSKDLLIILGSFFCVLLMSAHIIWLIERKINPDFPHTYLKGVFESMWWTVVTVTTVGYGDKTPKGWVGKLFGLFWMCAGALLFTYFVASVTAALTHKHLTDQIIDVSDLTGKKIGTIKQSTSDFFLRKRQIQPILYESLDQAINDLESDKLDAIIYDSPTLMYIISQPSHKTLKLVGTLLKHEDYSFALSNSSPFLEKLNTAILQMKEDGTYQNIHRKWFGDNYIR